MSETIFVKLFCPIFFFFFEITLPEVTLQLTIWNWNFYEFSDTYQSNTCISHKDSMIGRFYIFVMLKY